MPALLESPPNPITLNEVAAISQSLAEDLAKLQLRTEGFTEADYMTLDGSYFVEYVDGRLQVLPMPESIHQVLAFLLCSMLTDFARRDPGDRVLMAPFKIKLRDGQYREPDVCYMLAVNAHRRMRTHWNGADLIIEVISESNRDHDTITKRREYEINGVPEYWLVDPSHRSISILTLNGSTYAVHGEFRDGQVARSKLLSGFAVDVTRLFDDAASAA